MRLIVFLLAALLVGVHAELWFGNSGIFRVAALQKDLDQLKQANEAARIRNEQLGAEVNDLKEGLEMVEERARMELGMVRPQELLVLYTSDATAQRTLQVQQPASAPKKATRPPAPASPPAPTASRTPARP
jgi:cell division protein FtsB